MLLEIIMFAFFICLVQHIRLSIAQYLIVFTVGIFIFAPPILGTWLIFTTNLYILSLIYKTYKKGLK